MRKLHLIMIALTLSVVLLVTSVAPAMAARPASSPPKGSNVALPFEEVGELDGAPYKISVPANWNGTLIVYSHGLYIQMSPFGYPVMLAAPPGMIAPGSQGGPNTEEELLNAGYALAGSSYRGVGWVVKDGIQDTMALTSYFNDKVRKPEHTILWGFSMGGTIALEIIERSAGLFDGFVVEGSNGVPTTKAFDGFMNIQVAYDVIFGFPEEWGSVGNLRDDIEFGPDVWPSLFADLVPLSPDFDYARAEFFRLLILPLPQDVFYSMGWGTLMWFVTMVGANLEQKAGGNPLQNLDAPPLSLSSENISYLNMLGLDAQAMIDEMNAMKIEASPSARNYLEHYATPTGKIKSPLIQVHSVTDELNRVAGTGIYKNTVAEAERSDLLLQVYAGPGTGHGTLTKAQYLQTIAAMQEWLDTGERPDPGDYFTADYGFVPGYVPPPWQ